MIEPIRYDQEACPGLVTIVIPAYNRDHLIGATLETIRSQTYPNWEVIVVEDASVGETERIVNEFGDSVPNSVRYFRNAKNLGAADTRNVAFRVAQGQYIATLDSDDRWLPKYLQTMVDTLVRTGCDFAYADVTMVEDGTDRVIGNYGPTAEEVADFPTSLFSRGFLTPSATLMRRSVLERTGQWSSNHEYCEDYEFFLRCATLGVSFTHVPQSHCLYRKCHGDATTAKLALVVEAVAYTIRQYIGSPAIDPSTCRDYACKVFQQASRIHRRSKPENDASADRFRGGQLLIEAWRLRPARLHLLMKGLSVMLDSTATRMLVSKRPRPMLRTKIENLPKAVDILAQQLNRAEPINISESRKRAA
ncbi:UDP-Glc:alpha-D-GlcNAc-diphosphoundecaprenol beta-1,3-glucosyltransferase WfgD [Planctomycetes bacterium CA13]|uniref:UDP-Glc:alpha-D-GlcNAc-diphosphoundecaprenol beta-1,3-glucosyltransferase WfgD n=1 Tax=Novipirellula herctigrandis TaxID=2527986 RepID=A0A5C5YNI0_9BACT|nr:UDP-Glc:alpha-D-GlcNAc-diphosphoundecaprenol beta-1,3-glucosyltransferase WfgD [Planctomycetes bacterium CA13]